MALDSVEDVLYRWFIDQQRSREERGIAPPNVFPGMFGVSDIQDLAEKISKMIEPYRNVYLTYCRLENDTLKNDEAQEVFKKAIEDCKKFEEEK